MLMEEYTVNHPSIGYPKLQLDADILKVYYGDGSYAWTTIFNSYVKEAIKNVKKRTKDDIMVFNKKISDINYSPKNQFSAV